MKVAVSNIAWPVERDATVAEGLASLGVTGIEVAPTKIWVSPLEATDEQVDAYRRFWETQGISIIAAQALLFGRPDLTLFDDPQTREQTLIYLRGMTVLCARLGAKALVFGSPKNRRVGQRPRSAAWQEAIEFFSRLGEFALSQGTAIVMEANPAEYGADFITRAREALELVQAVNHPGFRLHLDTACMTMAGDDPDAIIPDAVGVLAHFHASEPQLLPVERGVVQHRRFGSLLARVAYAGWVSIEMRQVDPFDFGDLRRAITHVKASYGGSNLG